MSKATELNELVLDYQTNKAAGKRENISNSTKLVNIAMELTQSQRNQKEYQDVDFYEVLVNCLKGYNESNGNNFINYLRRALRNKMCDVNKNANNEKELTEIYLDDDRFDIDQHEKIEDENKYEIDKHPEGIELYDCMLNAIRVYQKKNPKSRFSLFFSEAIARTVSEDLDVYNHINNNSTRYLSTISIDFINSYTKKECSTVTDIMRAELKPQSDFIEGGSEKPCGYKLINEVYARYLGISTARISQMKNDYKVMMAEKLN